MNVHDFVSRLDAVQPTGENRWRARCPSHQGKSRSLSVSVTRDGSILIHCFAGCGALDVVNAVGLELKDLFPEPPISHRTKGRRPPPDWRALLRAVAREARILTIGSESMARGQPLTDDDRELINRAYSNLEAFAGRWL